MGRRNEQRANFFYLLFSFSLPNSVILVGRNGRDLDYQSSGKTGYRISGAPRCTASTYLSRFNFEQRFYISFFLFTSHSRSWRYSLAEWTNELRVRKAKWIFFFFLCFIPFEIDSFIYFQEIRYTYPKAPPGRGYITSNRIYNAKIKYSGIYFVSSSSSCFLYFFFYSNLQELYFNEKVA